MLPGCREWSLDGAVCHKAVVGPSRKTRPGPRIITPRRIVRSRARPLKAARPQPKSAAPDPVPLSGVFVRLSGGKNARTFRIDRVSLRSRFRLRTLCLRAGRSLDILSTAKPGSLHTLVVCGHFAVGVVFILVFDQGVEARSMRSLADFLALASLTICGISVRGACKQACKRSCSTSRQASSWVRCLGVLSVIVE